MRIPDRAAQSCALVAGFESWISDSKFEISKLDLKLQTLELRKVRFNLRAEIS